MLRYIASVQIGGESLDLILDTGKLKPLYWDI
jgi:hypothetical protein